VWAEDSERDKLEQPAWFVYVSRNSQSAINALSSLNFGSYR
jgi:hypothetical protein